MKTQLLHLAFAHILAILFAPALGAIMLLIQDAKSFDQLLRSGALLSLIFAALSSYVFFLMRRYAIWERAGNSAIQPSA